MQQDKPNRIPFFISAEQVSTINVGGGAIRNVKFDSRHTSGDIYVVEGVMPPGSSVPLHVHTHEDEIFHALEGEAELILGEQTLIGTGGDMVYLPRAVPHAIKAIGEQPARVLNYVFPGRNFEILFSKLSALPPDAGKEQKEVTAAEHGIQFL